MVSSSLAISGVVNELQLVFHQRLVRRNIGIAHQFQDFVGFVLDSGSSTDILPMTWRKPEMPEYRPRKSRAGVHQHRLTRPNSS
jgi:hypothetical protein